MKTPRDLSGMRLDGFEVLHLGEDECGVLWWLCKCDCGEEFICKSKYYLIHKCRGCGCRRRKGSGRRVKHGQTVNKKPSLTAVSYYSARSRCNNPKDSGYHKYGGRGIEFRFGSLLELIQEIGERPNKKMSIDRINNDGHYEKGNVRWATKSQQSSNQRRRTVKKGLNPTK